MSPGPTTARPHALQRIYVLPVSDSYQVFYSPELQSKSGTVSEGLDESAGLAGTNHTCPADDGTGDKAHGTDTAGAVAGASADVGAAAERNTVAAVNDQAGQQHLAAHDPAHLLMPAERAASGSQASSSKSWLESQMNSLMKSYDRFMSAGDRDSWKTKVVNFMKPADSHARMLQAIDTEVNQIEIVHPSTLCPDEIHSKLLLILHMQRPSSKLTYYGSWAAVPLTSLMGLLPGPNVWLAANLVHLLGAYRACKSGDALAQILDMGRVAFVEDKALSAIYTSEAAWEQGKHDADESFIRDEVFENIAELVEGPSGAVMEVLRKAKQQKQQEAEQETAAAQQDKAEVSWASLSGMLGGAIPLPGTEDDGYRRV